MRVPESLQSYSVATRNVYATKATSGLSARKAVNGTIIGHVHQEWHFPKKRELVNICRHKSKTKKMTGSSEKQNQTMSDDAFCATPAGTGAPTTPQSVVTTTRWSDATMTLLAHEAWPLLNALGAVAMSSYFPNIRSAHHVLYNTEPIKHTRLKCI